MRKCCDSKKGFGSKHLPGCIHYYEPPPPAEIEDEVSYGDTMRLFSKLRQFDKAVSRESAAENFTTARSIAEAAGMMLYQHTEAHYSLRHRGWIINIYPGNHRIKSNGPGSPYLNLPDDWTLTDVVHAAIGATQGV